MRAAGVWLSSFLVGCASDGTPAPASPTDPPAACTRQLGERTVPRPPVKPEPPVLAPPSRLIVHVEAPLAKLAAELEQSVPSLLAARQGIGVGPAGALDYSAERGPFSLSIAGGKLVVVTPVSGHAQACRGGRCYASCEPRALVRTEIALWLRPDYRFDPSQVSLEFTRGCKVRALGGMLCVDVTPILKSALAPQLERVRREVDERLPDIRSSIERAWQKLSQPHPLPLGGCVMIEPLGLVQGPVQASGGSALARLALLARPELRADCNAPAPSAALPALSADAAMPDEDSVTLGMEVPLASLARAFRSAPPEARAEPRFHVAGATLEALGQNISAELTLGGDVCGVVALQARPRFTGEEGLIELTAGRLGPSDLERVRSTGLDPDVLAAELTRLPRVTPPFSLVLLRAAAPALASMLSDPSLSVSTRLSSLSAAGAAARGQNLVAWVEARGSLQVEQR